MEMSKILIQTLSRDIMRKMLMEEY